jgi:hypothetical protein
MFQNTLPCSHSRILRTIPVIETPEPTLTPFAFWPNSPSLRCVFARLRWRVAQGSRIGRGGDHTDLVAAISKVIPEGRFSEASVAVKRGIG